MALIKCKECGHEVSDKASMCPNCGCPIESVGAIQEKVVDEKPKKKKRWTWALIVVALFCLLGGGYYAYTKLFNSGSSKDVVVELTPEFVNAIQKYEKLGSFSEGMAAVMRDGKWGYINTKGEEVIPCQFTNPSEYYFASPFYEGLALIQENGKWGFIDTKGNVVIPINIEAEAIGRFSEGLAFVYKSDEDFSVIDKEGNTLFSDKCINFYEYYTEDFQESLLPSYRQGLLYVPISYDKFTVYDKQGNKTKEINQETKDELDKQEDLKPFTVFSKENGDKEDYQFYTVGLKDANGSEVIPAIYNAIGDVSAEEKIDVPNGVVLVVLEEMGEDICEGYGGGFDSPDAKRYYGYADLQGHDTFTQEVKDRCRKSREKAMQKIVEKRIEEEKEYEEYDVQSESVSGFDDAAPENYEVRKWLKGQWVRAEIDPTMVELIYYVYTFYPDGYNFSYGSEHTYNQSRDRLPYTVNGDVICSANGSPMLKIDRGRNELVDYDKPEEIYKRR